MSLLPTLIADALDYWRARATEELRSRAHRAQRHRKREPRSRRAARIFRALLATGEGEGSHLRALFGDVDLHTLLRLATLLDIDDLTLARAYARARETAAAANAELDEYAR